MVSAFHLSSLPNLTGAKWFDSRKFIKTEKNIVNILDTDLTNSLVRETFQSILPGSGIGSRFYLF